MVLGLVKEYNPVANTSHCGIHHENRDFSRILTLCTTYMTIAIFVDLQGSTSVCWSFDFLR